MTNRDTYIHQDMTPLVNILNIIFSIKFLLSSQATRLLKNIDFEFFVLPRTVANDPPVGAIWVRCENHQNIITKL